MAIKIKIPRRRPAPGKTGKRRVQRFSWRHPAIKIAAAAALVTAVICVAVFAHFYLKYEKIVDRRLKGQLFTNAARIYARPQTVWLSEQIGTEEIAAKLRGAGYSDASHRSSESPLGTYQLLPNGIEVQPGPYSYHNRDGAIIRIAGDKIDNIAGTGGLQGKPLEAYELEPQLITSVDPEARSKRQVVQFKDIPKVLVDAVISIEDRRFFQHNGVNYYRLVKAALIDLRGGTRAQGGSTLTMQMARAFFLTPQKTIKRKLTEMLIAIELEQKLSKEQIFELYANQVDLGQRGSYTINGFAEAARSYFNKDLRDINLPEAALLAGLVQAPSYLSPYRHPDRALERRNLVLDSMVETGAVTRQEAERAKATPLKLAPPNVEASDAPYFVDLIKDSVLSHFSERDIADNGYRVYTTLDPDLQKAAADAVHDGMKGIDEQVQRLRTRRVRVGVGKAAKWETKVLPGPQAQVALVAIDPHSGEVLALVGGRNYGTSQLDHALAKRPTGSVFKPFVYAAAVNTALNGDPMNVLTPATLIDDSPGTFTYGDQIYEPRNYKNEYHGLVTARYALDHSLNNATVRLAEQVGYDKVAALARAAGLASVQPTPAMALGAYDATPIDVAGAYTVFADDGVRITPVFAKSVRNANGDLIENFDTQKTSVLDPRVAYVMTTMMEGVINNGTAAGVRAMGFTAPAAGKTGTSHDGWFAGYTTNLLCVVWVGFDDYSDLRLSGATTAAPIWADFMKRALKVPEYQDVADFHQPSGVVDMQLDKNTNRIATASCPDTYSVAFIAGTEPTDTCDQQPGDHRGILSKILGIGTPPPPPPVVVGAKPAPVTRPTPAARPANGTVSGVNPAQNPNPEKKKKGFFGKIVGIFKGDDSPQKPSSPPPRR